MSISEELKTLDENKTRDQRISTKIWILIDEIEYIRRESWRSELDIFNEVHKT